VRRGEGKGREGKGREGKGRQLHFRKPVSVKFNNETLFNSETI
jgi:hypothetical protein